ncbi:hypothetical protein IJI91_01085 [Candidatus Saccharibacteria bacterium]|nr:hypothetical protein [Candidatus Saccharibacteria bacterium]
MSKDIEIPQGKRTKKYRFFEMLPAMLSYSLVILLFILSIINPLLGAIYLLLIIASTLVKAVGTAYRTLQGYKIVKKAQRVNWAKRLDDLAHPHDAYEKLYNTKSEAYDFDQHVQNLKLLSVADKGNHPDPKKIYHAIVMVAYNEGIETLALSIQAVADTTFDNQRIIFVLGYEERGGAEIEQTAQKLKDQFKDTFYEFLLVKHPDGIKGEIKGKGPNLTCAGEALAKYVEKKNIPLANVIVTSLDSDNRLSKPYLDYVAYEFVVNNNRQHMSFQPVSLFMNNIWDAPAPMRVVGVSNSFFNIITTMRPHAIRNFASHSQPLAALKGMNFWSKRTIVEDGHQFWRSLFYFDGDYEVLPIRVPIYQDVVIGDTLWEALKAQFIQLRRWDYGASDVAYVGVRLFSKDRNMPFWPLFTKFVRLLDGHVMLAVMAPVVAFGGWVPMLMNLGARSAVAYNLPSVVGIIQTVAMIGLLVTILTSMKMLPKRPERYKKGRSALMVLQWVLMPFVAILYQSAAAFYSQTRLFLGKYMENFDVTRKIVKN